MLVFFVPYCVNFYALYILQYFNNLSPSLSIFFVCVRPQFTTNPPNTARPPPPQFITIHDISITKSTKNKGKSNQKSIQTQNQPKKTLNNLKTNSTKNSSTQTQNQTQTQIEAVVVATAIESLLPLENPSQKQPKPSENPSQSQLNINPNPLENPS